MVIGRKRRPKEEASMKLYEFAPTRSIRVRWTLQDLGVEYEAVTVNLVAGEHRRPEFLAINFSKPITLGELTCPST